ncbi:MAG: hypothetical protein WD851_09720 [Pirellulales bacterium]
MKHWIAAWEVGTVSPIVANRLQVGLVWANSSGFASAGKLAGGSAALVAIGVRR